MSSTYVIAKRAAACVDESGILYYLLSEESYESNVYPRTPKWTTRFFGRYEDCIARIIDGSSSIEGGSLKGEARSSTAYIKQWRDRLANPVRLELENLVVHFSGGIYGLPQDALEPVSRLAAKHGQPAPEGGALKVDMERNGALAFLAELFDGTIEGMFTWRFFRKADFGTVPVPGLGTPVPKAVAANLDGFEVFKIKSITSSDHDHFINAKGAVRSTGWAYSTMGSFICNEAAAAERAMPGSAEPMIHAFRKLVAEAKDLPALTRITITMPQGHDDSDEYQARKLREFCSAMALPIAPTVEFTYQDMVKADIVGDLRYLSNEFLSFDINSILPAKVNAEAAIASQDQQQQLLLA